MPAIPVVTRSAAAAMAAGSVRYIAVATGPVFAGGTGEVDQCITYRYAGTLSNLACYLTSNDRGASTMRLRKNGANGNGVLSIGASATGFFEDVTNTDSVAVGDTLAYEYTAGTGGTVCNLVACDMHFTPSGSEAVARYWSNPGALSTASTTFYEPISSLEAWASSGESSTQVAVAVACTARNLYVRVSSPNGRTTSTTFGTRKNGANGNMSVSVGSSATGTFEDTTNSDSLAAADLYNFYCTTGSGTGTITPTVIGVTLVTADDTWTAGGNNPTNNTIAAATTRYTYYSGSANVNATEATRQTKIRQAGYISRLWAKITANTIAASSTYTLRVNGADTALTVSIGSLATGEFTDNTHSVAVAVADTLNFKMVTGGAAGSMTLRAHSTAGAANRTLSPAGVASDETNGTPTVLPGAVSVAPAGVAGDGREGTPTVTPGAVTVAPAGVSSDGREGTPTITTGAVTVSPAGVATDEREGTPTVTPGAVTVAPTGVASDEREGTPAVTTGAVTVSPSGAASDESVGTPTVVGISVFVYPAGIGTDEAVGTPGVTPGSVTIIAAAIASDEAVGTPTLTPGAVTISVVGVDSAEQLGDVLVTAGAVTVSVIGVGSDETVGSPVLGMAQAIDPTGVGSDETVGTPGLTPGAVTILPTGISSDEAVGLLMRILAAMVGFENGGDITVEFVEGAGTTFAGTLEIG